MTTQRTQLVVSPRTVVGKKVKTLRSSGLTPANVFSKGKESTSVQVDTKAFLAAYKKTGETGLIDLKIEGENMPRPVLVDNVDRHPVSDKVLHVDFHEVNLKEKVTAMIPVEAVGDSEAVKAGHVLVMPYNELEVEALPTDLPEKFEVDITALKAVGDDVKLSDVNYDREKVEVQGIDQDEVVATIQAMKEEVVEEASATPTEVELTKQGATTEEGKALEGGAAPKAE
jgi:large subunit ribosomal protein L25